MATKSVQSAEPIPTPVFHVDPVAMVERAKCNGGSHELAVEQLQADYRSRFVKVRELLPALGDDICAKLCEADAIRARATERFVRADEDINALSEVLISRAITREQIAAKKAELSEAKACLDDPKTLQLSAESAFQLSLKVKLLPKEISELESQAATLGAQVIQLEQKTGVDLSRLVSHMVARTKCPLTGKILSAHVRHLHDAGFLSK